MSVGTCTHNKYLPRVQVLLQKHKNPWVQVQVYPHLSLGILLGVVAGLNGLVYWMIKQRKKQAQVAQNIPMVFWRHQEA